MLKINIEQATTYWVAPNCLSHLTYDEMVKYKLGILVDNAAKAGTANRGGVLGVEPAPSDLDLNVDWNQSGMVTPPRKQTLVSRESFARARLHVGCNRGQPASTAGAKQHLLGCARVSATRARQASAPPVHRLCHMPIMLGPPAAPSPLGAPAAPACRPSATLPI